MASVFDLPYWTDRRYAETAAQLRHRIAELEAKGNAAPWLRARLADLNSWIVACEEYHANHQNPDHR